MNKDDVFEYGDQTTFRLRDQEFVVDDFGTVANVPTPEVPPAQESESAPAVGDETRLMPAPVSYPELEGAPEARTTPGTTPAAQMTADEKLDAILHALEALRRRVDSIDAMIARVLTR